MLTKVQAIKLLQDSWHMKNVEEQLQNDREKFLNKLIVTIHEKVPFQLLYLRTIAFLPPEKRVMPALEEIEKMCMSGMGGNCTVINMFCRSLFKALGFSAYNCRTTVTSNEFNPHLVVIIKDLVNKGDFHLVDCGLGLPSFQAISLNFSEESPVYYDSFLEYKFIKHDGKILRMHGQGDIVVRNNPPKDGLDFIRGKWRRFFEFEIETLEPNSIYDLGPIFSGQYLPVHRLEPRAARFPAGEAVLLIAGDQLYIEQEDKTLKKVVLGSKDRIFKMFQDYFPSIDKDLVREAYSTWNKSKL